MGNKVSRNDPCPCGSGKKYKKCCLTKIVVTASIWDKDKVGSMPTDEIFNKLSFMGIQTDRDEFLRDAHNIYSASSLANHWCEPQGIEGSDADFVYLAAVCLWERLAPDVFNDEMIDNLMQHGYVELGKRRSEIACRLWLTTWGYLKPRFTSDMKSIRDAEKVFAGQQNLHNWTQDLEMELGNANLHEDRIEYCHEFCELFPESPESIILNMRMAEAEGYFHLGERDKVEAIFSDLQQQNPDNVWIYCRWGDLFVYSRKPDFVPDYEKAERTYRMAFDRDLDEEGDVMDRISDMKKMQKKKG